MTPETLKGLASGTIAGTPASEALHRTSIGSERLFIEARLGASSNAGTLRFEDGATKGDQVRAIRALARILHPELVAAAAMPDAGDREQAAGRIAEAARRSPGVAHVDDAVIFDIVSRGRYGQMYQGPTPRNSMTRQVEVSHSLRRMCAIFEWPPERQTMFDTPSLAMEPVYNSTLFAITWKPRDASGSLGRVVRRFDADLTDLRLIATGEKTHVIVQEESPEPTP